MASALDLAGIDQKVVWHLFWYFRATSRAKQAAMVHLRTQGIVCLHYVHLTVYKLFGGSSEAVPGGV